MLAKLKYGAALVVAACLTLGSLTNSALAISVEVAKKCQALAAEAYSVCFVFLLGDCLLQFRNFHRFYQHNLRLFDWPMEVLLPCHSLNR